MSWIDSHCHLDLLREGPDRAVSDARAAGVESIITIGISLETSRGAVELARRFGGVYAAVGIHPNESGDLSAADAAEVEELAGRPGVVAIGEVGLDFYRDHATPEQQHRAFRAQIAVAKRTGLPMVMHIRDAFDEVIRVLEEVGPPQTLIFHCFSGGPAEARTAVGIGGYVSFAGNVSFRNAENLRDAARAVPLERLLVETDSPFLTPVPFRGKPNRPRHVVEVGRALAQAVGVPAEEMAQITQANTRRAFRLAE